MCGIIGYVGRRDGVPVVVSGLKSLEYRGYDSWGIAALREGELRVVKRDGKIGEVSERDLDLPAAPVVMGHTRWATHGRVCPANAHPHLSADGTLAVVHNGIIENHAELRGRLREKGCVFSSETDSEVIAHLIGEHAKGNDFERAVRLTLDELDGTFAVVVLHAPEMRLIAARRASPLVVGIGTDGYYVASDLPAFITHTREAVFLEDDEMAVLDTELRISCYETGKPVVREAVRVEADAEQAQKGDFEHFMLKEIYEQPSALRNTISSRIRGGRVVFEDLPLGESYLASIDRVCILGCGTSWHAALIGKYTLEALGKIPVEVDYSSEFRYRNPVLGSRTLVIAMSQSGETADTLAAVREARSKGARVLSVCNVAGSSIPREADATLTTRAGIEIGVASTKAFTTQIAVLYLLGVHLAQLRGTWPRGHLEERLAFLQRIPSQMEEVLGEDGGVLRCARDMYLGANALYLGRGTSFPVALEGALKLKEVSYMHAEGYPAAEMKHGPIALIDHRMPAVVICVKDRSYAKIKGNMEEIRSRGGRIIAVATEGDETLGALAGHVLHVPATSGLAYPFLTVLPLQLLAYHIARLRECDIDKPRNLAKSVTVE